MNYNLKGTNNKMTNKNLFLNTEEEFFIWIDPLDIHVYQNLGIVGCLSTNTAPLWSRDGNIDGDFPFIPNPNYKGGFITPYFNNLYKKIYTERWLAEGRPKQYPSRMHAAYLLRSREDANAYKEHHSKHVKGRILVNGFSSAQCQYSIHDSSWFDFLCLGNLDDTSIKKCVEAYWLGVSVEECNLQQGGKPWKQPATMEVLFYGNLKITENSKKEIKAAYCQDQNAKYISKK